MSSYDILVKNRYDEVVFLGVSESELEKEKRRLGSTNLNARIEVVPNRKDSFFDKTFGINN